MKKVDITYKNGFKQIRNVVLQSEFECIIKPKRDLIYTLENVEVNKKKAHALAKKLKHQLKEKYGEFITTKSPMYYAIESGILNLPECQGGNHKISIKFI
mgnify:CR=1 FL=1